MNIFWQVDDHSIPDSAYVYRRIKLEVDTVRDLADGSRILNLSAYRYTDDGMSVFISWMMNHLGVTLEQITDWSTNKGNGLARVTLAVIRREDEGEEYVSRTPPIGTVLPGSEREQRGGVVFTPANDSSLSIRVRMSHGLVRIDQPPKATQEWNAFRNKLVQNTQLLTELSGTWNNSVN